MYLSQTVRLYMYLPNFEQPIYKPWVEDHLLVFMKGGMVGDVWEGGELVIRPIHTFAPAIGIGEKANRTKLLPAREPMPFAFFTQTNKNNDPTKNADSLFTG